MTILKNSFIGIGVDTARYGHHVSFLDQDKRVATKAFHFQENQTGYQRFHRTIRQLAEKNPDATIHVRIDAAGQYAENLIQWLNRIELPLEISLGQPAKNKAYRKAHFDKRKADPVESLACARFAVVERPPSAPLTPAEFSQLRDVVALLESSAKQRTRLVNQLHNLLARVFPELATITGDIAASWVLALLLKYPTAERVAAARSSSLLKIPHIDEKKAAKLAAAAKSSTGSARGEVIEELVKQKVRAIQDEQAQGKKLHKLLEKAFAALPAGPHHRLLTIPGIGLQTAAALVAKMISITRFESASRLIGYFAVFPEEVDVSGTDKQGRPKVGTQMRMSRKGNDQVRRLLYTAAQCASQHNPAVKAVFARQMAKGKAYNVAMGHCMAKLLRQVYAVWQGDCDFDPNYETAPKAPVASESEKDSQQAQEKSRGPQSGLAAKESGHHDSPECSEQETEKQTSKNTEGGAPSVSPARRPDTGSAQVDAPAGRKGRPHSVEPKPRSAPPKKSTRHHAQRT